MPLQYQHYQQQTCVGYDAIWRHVHCSQASQQTCRVHMTILWQTSAMLTKRQVHLSHCKHLMLYTGANWQRNHHFSNFQLACTMGWQTQHSPWMSSLNVQYLSRYRCSSWNALWLPKSSNWINVCWPNLQHRHIYAI